MRPVCWRGYKTFQQSDIAEFFRWKIAILQFAYTSILEFYISTSKMKSVLTLLGAV